MAIAKKLGISIAQAESNSSSSLWVLNTTDRKGASKGVFLFTVANGQGRQVTVRVPCTISPVDLSTQATKASILTEPEFRKAITAGVLVILSQEEVDAMFNDSNVREEYARVTGANEFVDNDNKTEAVQSDESTVGATAASIVGIAVEDEGKAMSILRNNVNNLTKIELEYIVANATSQKIKTYCAERLV